MITLQTNYDQHDKYDSNHIENSQKTIEKQSTAVAAASFQNVLDDLLNQPAGSVTHTNHNTGAVTNGLSETQLPDYDYRYDSIRAGTTAANVLPQSGDMITTTYRGWTPKNPIERNQLWNRIAQEHPEALKSKVTDSQGYDNLLEAQAAEVREKLRALGVDMMTSAIIASREVATTVRRPDGSVPGYGSSGYQSLPASVKSTPVHGEKLAREGVGYAYVNRYGKTQVVQDLARALDYTADGDVYEYTGFFGGGHAYNSSLVAQQLSLTNSMISSADKQFSYRVRQLTDLDINRMTQIASR